jgi:uracil phosphoribosyltransferase
MFRAKESLLPVQYYNRLPKDHNTDIAFIVDPCIATSNTLHAVCSILKRWGAKKVVVISAIGARPGVDKILELHPDVDLYIGQIDETLSPEGMIIPGIGDAGDRQFRTPSEELPVTFLGAATGSSSDEASKRKRTDA